jgi:Domain of unknown function (DUF5069)
MLKKDLTTSYPRSVHEKMVGVVQLPRAIDKGIAFANGTNGEYNYDCPMDKHTFGVFGIDAAALLEVIKKAQSEAEIEAYLAPIVAKKSADEIAAFNDEMLSDGPTPGTPGEEYFLSLRNGLDASRTDITTWADVLDLDEKRVVPKRAVVA